jgi:hypothetical protein
MLPKDWTSGNEPAPGGGSPSPLKPYSRPAGPPAVYGDAVPVVIGTGRVKAQLVFRSAPSTLTEGGKLCLGELLQDVAARWSEVAVYAICEAPVTDVLRHWNGSVPAAGFAKTVWDTIITATGTVDVIITATASAWAALAGTDAAGMGFSGTVHARVSRMLLRPDNGEPPNLEFEVKSTLADAASPDGNDTLAADALVFLLTDPRNGIGLSSSMVDVDLGADRTAASSYRRHCQQQGLWVSRVLLRGEKKADVIQSLLDATDATLIKIDGKYRAIPMADRPVGTFTPDTSFQAISDSDFFGDDGDHIRVERLGPQDRTLFPVQFSSRSVDYHELTVEGWDAAAISDVGPKRAEVFAVPWTITEAHAKWIAETLALRALTNRNKYTLRLMPKWGVILVPTDFLSVTESKSIGLVNRLMRVKRVKYLRDGGVQVEAIEWLSIQASGVTSQTGAGLLTTAVTAGVSATYADTASALSTLSDIASDNVLTPGEKPPVILDNSTITGEQSGIDDQATNYGITTEKTTYDNAVSALTTYLATLTTPVAWNNLTGNTTIVGTTFRSKFADVYSARQALLDAIAARSSTVNKAAAISDRDNVWPGPSSEITPPTGADTTAPEWADRYNAGAGAYSGSWVRRITGAANGFWIPVSPDALFYAEAQAKRESGTGSGGRLNVGFYPTLGSFTSGTVTNGAYSTSSSWTKVTVTSAAAPAGTNAAYISYEAGSGDTCQFDALLARRVMQPETVASEIVNPSSGANWSGNIAVRRTAGMISGIVNFQATTGASFATIITLPSGARPMADMFVPARWYSAAALVAYPAIVKIASTTGVCSLLEYDNETSFVAPPAAGNSDIVEFNFAFNWI